MSPQRRLAILRIAFWAAALFAFVMAILPHPPEVPGAPSDKVQHIAAFLTLAALASFAYPTTSPVYLGTGLSLFGAFIELVQYVPSLHRDSDPLDWIADTAATALMLIFLHWLRGKFSEAVSRKS
ncbi:hypothetical protein LZ016_06055 [Sphingomonas sp. SM33]|uniref:VanZ family protein n=1 Tax=Sphingomonas telluris TaxID=2907998 RepID=A0ABS9VML4_9SPHN|nr:hypothetical protein [Sphingomonas telluris]MCH8615662.1 hypothetical protein [Sphingomonas telluris]